MTTAERIAEKRDKIKKAKERIAAEQEKINKLNKEIEELESLEVKGLLKELNMPLSEFKELIKGLNTKKPTAAEPEKDSTENQNNNL